MKIKLFFGTICIVGITLILLYLFVLQKTYYTDIYYENENKIQQELYGKENELIKIHFINRKDNQSINIKKGDISKIIDIQEVLKDGHTYSKDTLEISEKGRITVIGKLKKTQNGGTPKIDYESKNIPEKDIEIFDINLLMTIPGDITLKKSKIWSDKVSLIEISGKDVNKVKYISINNKKIPVLFFNSGYFISLDNNLLNAGSYQWFGITEKKEKIQGKNFLEVLNKTEKTAIYEITPSKIKSKTGGNIVLQGKGLDKILSIQLSNNLIFKQTQFIVLSPNVIALNIPENIDIGLYYLNIVTPEKITSSDNLQLEIIY